MSTAVVSSWPLYPPTPDLPPPRRGVTIAASIRGKISSICPIAPRGVGRQNSGARASLANLQLSSQFGDCRLSVLRVHAKFLELATSIGGGWDKSHRAGWVASFPGLFARLSRSRGNDDPDYAFGYPKHPCEHDGGCQQASHAKSGQHRMRAAVPVT